MLEFGAEGLGGDLGRHGKFAGARIGGDKLDLVDADGGAFVVAQALLDLLREVLRLGAAHGKGADQAGKVLERYFIGEQDTGKPGGGQQLCETALSLPGFERNAIEKKFIVRDAEQETSVAAFRQRLLKFFPGRVELALGALVGYSVQPRVLDQNIEAVQKRPSGRATAGIDMRVVSDNSLLSIYRASATRLSGKET